MGLDLDTDVHVITETNHTRIVPENRQTEVLRAHAFAQQPGAALNAGLVQAVDDRRHTRGAVLVFDAGAEDLVLCGFRRFKGSTRT